ncbi:alpha/beta hydrolase family protein [Dysgonomonas reticulitermitis]
MTKKQKKYIKITISIIIILFIVLNAGIIVQSYSLTHFDENAKPMDPEYEPTFKETIGIALFGLDMPKPKARQYPNRHYETLYISAGENRKLEAWSIHTDSIKYGTVLCFHGYMDEKSSMLDRAYAFLDMGYDVLLIDFMGAGGSYGNQTTIGFLEAENVKAVHDYTVSALKEDKIIMAGFSMGAAAIMKAQADYDLLTQGLILEAPYSSFKNAVGNRIGKLSIPKWPAADLFTFWTGVINGFNAFKANPQDYAKKINVPTLLMCGGKDQNIPTEETFHIFDQLAGSKKKLEIFPESTHQSYLIKYPKEWYAVTYKFLNELEQLDIYNE